LALYVDALCVRFGSRAAGIGADPSWCCDRATERSR